MLGQRAREIHPLVALDLAQVPQKRRRAGVARRIGHADFPLPLGVQKVIVGLYITWLDQVGIDNSYTIELNVIHAAGHVAIDYFMGETVYQSPDGTWANNISNAIVKEWFGANGTIQLYNIVGEFSNNTLLWGNTSNAVWNVATTDTMSNLAKYDFSDNVEVNQDAEGLLDLSVNNPFGNI